MTSLASLSSSARAAIGKGAAHFAPSGGPTGARRSTAPDPNAKPEMPPAATKAGGAGGAAPDASEASASVAAANASADNNPVVFLDISVGGVAVGRLEIELFAAVAPRTCENFRALCVGTYGFGDSAQLHYAGCRVHRVVPGFCIQGGDLTENNGRGGESIFGRTFPDENFALRHDAAGLLSMANAGKDSNGSQFFVLCGAAPHLDGRHVVFGRVAKGMDVVRRVEAVGTRTGATTAPVFITCSGQLRGLDPVLPRAVVKRGAAGGGGGGATADGDKDSSSDDE